MSHDNYKENPQEAATRAAASMLDFGMFCMRKYMEECSNLLKLSNYISGSYTEIFYGKGIQAERLFVKPRIEMNFASEIKTPGIIIPIHKIEEATYGEKKIETPTDLINPVLKN